ncbi:MAG: lipoate--protein ligase family protein [Chlamydiae bacterium]|nr:lipoate--protein ligase family protein [Chlamydiota bacterium]
MNILELFNTPILEQLQIEEALLRLSDEDYCILNHGSTPAIVMGISGNPEELINLEKLASSFIPVIRRYSGGGTVVVDQNTLFVSFIFQKQRHEFASYPENIMQWSANFYEKALNIPSFQFRENDYVIGHQKVGGNAQYIQKNRWMHHTSFLYAFDEEKMQYLTLPKKRPLYRESRSHSDFLTTLAPFFPDRAQFFDKVKELLKTSYNAKSIQLENVKHLLDMPYRKVTTLIDVPLGTKMHS